MKFKIRKKERKKERTSFPTRELNIFVLLTLKRAIDFILFSLLYFRIVVNR